MSLLTNSPLRSLALASVMLSACADRGRSAGQQPLHDAAAVIAAHREAVAGVVAARVGGGTADHRALRAADRRLVRDHVRADGDGLGLQQLDAFPDGVDRVRCEVVDPSRSWFSPLV